MLEINYKIYSQNCNQVSNNIFVLQYQIMFSFLRSTNVVQQATKNWRQLLNQVKVGIALKFYLMQVNYFFISACRQNCAKFFLIILGEII